MKKQEQTVLRQQQNIIFHPDFSTFWAVTSNYLINLINQFLFWLKQQRQQQNLRISNHTPHITQS